MANESAPAVATADDDLLELLLGDADMGDGIIDMDIDAAARPGRPLPLTGAPTITMTALVHC
ncbi:hypothetical protein ABZ436_08610 [Micromonospora matsumotoense]|uniref:hypothetical protein n=1 Tax=Micromonospora matsumotoense TaxID=121616 RepID=UPI0033DB1CC4